jgi:hypothetical protein
MLRAPAFISHRWKSATGSLLRADWLWLPGWLRLPGRPWLPGWLRLPG